MKIHFLTIKRSLPCLTQVRYLNNQGQEIIRVEGKPIGLFKEKATSKIIESKNLQDKSNSYYFKEFKKLEQNKIGISYIDLNKEKGKISLPKQPTLRLGMALFDTQQKRKGVLVFNICLKTFFKLLNKTTLYYVHILDKDGNFISHHNEDYSIIGDKHDNYKLKNEFPNSYKDILTSKEYYNKHIYVKNINNFDNNQGLKLLLELKYNKISKDVSILKDNIILLLVIIALIFLPIIFYFSKLPDLLEKKLKKQIITSNLTNLPNRIALMHDLEDNQYSDSIILLVNVDNLLKVQNIYGYDISNSILKLLSEYLVAYEDKNIRKIYLTSYNSFAIKYQYSDDNELLEFLDKFIHNVEDKSFFVDDDNLEFILNITVGVSDPNKLNNNIDELKEAELALENALEKNLDIFIYHSEHQQQLKKNKNNLDIAKKIQKAIKEDKVQMHYQPIYNLSTKKIEKYESLIRIKFDDEIIYPDTFFTNIKRA